MLPWCWGTPCLHAAKATNEGTSYNRATHLKRHGRKNSYKAAGATLRLILVHGGANQPLEHAKPACGRALGWPERLQNSWPISQHSTPHSTLQSVTTACTIGGMSQAVQRPQGCYCYWHCRVAKALRSYAQPVVNLALCQQCSHNAGNRFKECLPVLLPHRHVRTTVRVAMPPICRQLFTVDACANCSKKGATPQYRWQSQHCMR